MIRKKRSCFVILLAALALLCSSCSLFPSSNEPAAPTLLIPKPISYETTPVVRGNLTIGADGYGTVKSVRYARHYFSQSGGRVSDFLVKAGDEVKAGQTLVVLNDGSKLTARVDGIVAYVNNEYITGLDLNKQVLAGVTMVAIDERKPEDLYLVFSRFTSVNPDDFPVGTKLTLRKMNENDSFEGIVVSSTSIVQEIGGEANVKSNELYCKMINPPEGIVSGDSIHYEYVETELLDCLLLPIYAYHTNELGQKYVYVLDENNLKKERFIETGLSTITQVEVLSGLEEGELVVLS